jgi:hypothetical protein
MILILGNLSCNKTGSDGDTPPVIVTYDATKMIVTVNDTISGTAGISLTAKDVKGLGYLTIGVCYSTAAEPTLTDPHFEIILNADTLKTADLKLTYLATNLTLNTEYFVKGYVLTLSNTYYSTKKSITLKSHVLTIKVASDYIPSGKEYWAVLSNNTTTLITQKLQNGQTYTFSDNIPAKADFHLFKWDATNFSLTVQSYTSIVPDNFNLLNTNAAKPNVGQATVTISDLANTSGWGVAGSWYWNSTTSGTTKTLSTSLLKNPDEVFIYCLPSSGAAPLYKNITNVTPASTYTYTMSNLTAMPSYTSISLPVNNYFYYDLAGFNTDYYTEYKRYHSYTYSSGYTGTFKLYYPTGINTNYFLYATYATANQQSIYFKKGPLPTTFFNTFPTITITNSSQFKTTTTAVNNFADFEAAVVIGTYSSSPLYIQWDYYTQPLASNTVQIPEFPVEVKAKINNLSNSALTFANSAFIDISNGQVTSYDSFVDLMVKKSSRTYDVINERRIYYQWISKKSSGTVMREFESR